jgi:Zn-dependent protease
LNIAALLISFGLLIVAMTIHEFAHGFTAYKLGDSTAKYSGRLTLNPLAHIDPFGTIILPLFLFLSTGFAIGWAKPVPINYWALRNPKKDIIWVGLSGPLANIILAFLLGMFWRAIPLNQFSALLLQKLIYINLLLGVFNLIPIPPLDGSRIVMGLLPPQMAYRYSAIEPYGFVIVAALSWMGLFDLIIWPVVRLISLLLAIPL